MILKFWLIITCIHMSKSFGYSKIFLQILRYCRYMKWVNWLINYNKYFYNGGRTKLGTSSIVRSNFQFKNF